MIPLLSLTCHGRSLDANTLRFSIQNLPSETTLRLKMFAQNSRGKSDSFWLRSQTLVQRPIERVIESQDIFTFNDISDASSSSSKGRLRLTSMTRRPLLWVFLLGSLLIGLTVLALGIVILIKFQRRRRLSSSLTTSGGSCHLTTSGSRGSSSDQLNQNEKEDDDDDSGNFKRRSASSSSGFLRRLTDRGDRDEDKCNLNEDFGDERRLTCSLTARNDCSSSGTFNGRKPYHPNDYGSSKGPPDIIPSFAQHNISFLSQAGCSSSSSLTSSPASCLRRLSLHLPSSSVTPTFLPPSLPSTTIPPQSDPHHHVVLDDDDDQAKEAAIEGDTATSSSGLNDKNFSTFGQSS